MTQDEDEILAGLRAHDKTAAWLATLDAADDPPVDMLLPPASGIPGVLRDLGVTDEDITELTADVPGDSNLPEIWRLAQRTAWSIVGQMGMIGDWPPLPRWPESTGAAGRGFYVWVYLAGLPFVQGYHRARGIHDAISRDTLADLGRSIRHGRRRYGHADVHDPWWMALDLRGALYELGRLQFERSRVGTRTAEAMVAAGVAVAPETPALSVHIPAYSGPLDPAACDAAFSGAVAFFAQHFPEERYEFAVCYSWMLDSELPEYLPKSSNIIRFTDRFHPAYRFDESDATILRFVFGRPDLPLDSYPQGTTLERGVIAHLKAGRHWHGGAGWLRLPGAG